MLQIDVNFNVTIYIASSANSPIIRWVHWYRANKYVFNRRLKAA